MTVKKKKHKVSLFMCHLGTIWNMPLVVSTGGNLKLQEPGIAPTSSLYAGKLLYVNSTKMTMASSGLKSMKLASMLGFSSALLMEHGY